MGKLEVICGPMFSGKSEELLRRLKRAHIAKRPFQLFKPSIDNRYSETHVVSHSGLSMKCRVIDTAEELLSVPQEVKIVAIDECQFLGEDTPKVVEALVADGKRVIVAGLDMDSNGTPFDPMPQLMARAESVLKVTAVCESCGDDATHTWRRDTVHVGNNVDVGPSVLVGASDHYQARCRKHWQRW
jgi:thymidine kinase